MKNQSATTDNFDSNHNGVKLDRSYIPPQFTSIPCDCGHPIGHWRGPRTGRRSYLCDDCAAAMAKFGTALAEEMLRD